MEKISINRLAELLTFATENKDADSIKLIVRHAIMSESELHKQNSGLLYEALLCLCIPKPKRGRPARENKKATQFKYYCSLACKVKVETINMSLDNTKHRKKATFTSVWEEYNSSMARPVKQKDELWRCAGILNMLLSDKHMVIHRKEARIAVNRFQLNHEDIKKFI